MAAEEEVKCPPGAPGWLATFADLMSLLLTFFVLLLSSADMNAKKFKIMAQSMYDALSGVNLIGTPKAETMFSIDPRAIKSGKKDGKADQQMEVNDSLKKKIIEQSMQQFNAMSQQVSQELNEFQKTGMLTVETSGNKILVRYPAEATFAPGSEEVSKSILASLQRVAQIIKKYGAHVIVAGHTDDIPINTMRFRSNWDLSAARAVSVAHEILKFGELPSSVVEVVGYADSRPLVANTTPENRSANRRVELTITTVGKASEIQGAIENDGALGPGETESLPAEEEAQKP